MRRAVLFRLLVPGLLVLYLCASAMAQQTAPDGSVLPEAGPVALAGTTWLAQDVVGQTVYEFLPDGTLRYSYNGATYTNGTWRQNGASVYMETNKRYSERNGTVSGEVMSGGGKNVTGLTWKWSAVRQR